MAALIWKDLGSYIFAPEHHSYGAEGDDGQNYVVGINTDPKSDLFSGYYVAIEPVGTLATSVTSAAWPTSVTAPPAWCGYVPA